MQQRKVKLLCDIRHGHGKPFKKGSEQPGDVRVLSGWVAAGMAEWVDAPTAAASASKTATAS